MVRDMPDVQFNDPWYAKKLRSSAAPTGMAGLMIKLGFAKDAAGAQRALLVIAGLIAILAIVVFMYAMPSSQPLIEEVPLP